MREDGFAMADAIVALTIAAIFVTSLLGLNNSSLNSITSGANKLTATLIAKSILEDRSLRENSGSFLVAGQEFEWFRQTSSKPSNPNDFLQTNEVIVTVNWQGHQNQQTLVVRTSTYRLQKYGK